MPSLGADMEDGTLIEWRIKAGDAIHRGDIVALVETTKGIIDIESFEDAVVEQLLAPIGRQIPVGVPLAIFSGEATAAPAGPLPPPGKLDMPAAQARTERDHSRRAKVSPAARARAATSGVDAFAIAGSGPGGAVTLQDVETAAKKPSGAMRSAIGAALGRSKREIPHYYLQHSIDFGAARGWLDSYNAVRPAPERILPVALMIRAVALAAAQMPQFNGYYQLNAYAAVAAINVGVAIALRGEGLVAPAILDANRKSAAIIMTELQQLVARVRRGHMRSGELSAGTITLTSLGDEGIESLLPIIYPPQVAIVGFGSVVDRPWVADGRLVVRPVLHISLAADHRVSDGRQGAQFIARIADLMTKPAELCTTFQ
jgi:pyruvate dehydrogenase E2 component (dihydrolipoamide acetyltransferase)